MQDLFLLIEKKKIDDKNRIKKRHKLLYAEDKIEGIDFVKCPFCKERFLYLGSHFTNIHNTTIKSYRKEHPEWESKCQVFTESRRKAALDANKGGRKHSYDIINVNIEKEGWDYIYCKICSKPFRNLGNHLKVIHKLNAINYLVKFPNAMLIAEKIKDNNRKLLKKPLAVRVGEKRAAEIVKHTKDLKVKNGTNKLSITTRLKISKSNTGKKKSKESLIKQSNSLREGYTSGRIKITGTVNNYKKNYCQTPLQGVKLLRSFTELKYVQILNKHSNYGKDFIWLYEPITYKVDMKDNLKARSLTPDFQLLFDWNIDRVKKEFNKIILTKEEIQNICNRSYDRKIEETKGRWINNSIEFKKWNNFIEQYPDEKVEMVMHSQVSKMFKKHFGHLVNFIERQKYYENKHIRKD